MKLLIEDNVFILNVPMDDAETVEVCNGRNDLKQKGKCKNYKVPEEFECGNLIIILASIKKVGFSVERVQQHVIL